MSGGRVVIHFNERQELFDIGDFNIITVSELLKFARHRIYEDNDAELITGDLYECLCEGPYASEPLNDLRLRAIAEMVQQLMPPDSINQRSETEPSPVHLWLCNVTNNLFLFDNSLTTGDQHQSGATRPVDDNSISEEMRFQPTYSGAEVPQPLCTKPDSVQKIPDQRREDELAKLHEAADANLESLEKASESCDASNEASNESVLEFTEPFRDEQKKQYRVDVFPLNKKKKGKKVKLIKSKPTSQTTNKKRKTYKKSKKYAFHLQAVKSKKQDRSGIYPRVRLTRHHLDLLQKEEPVSLFVAVTKYINGCRYLDALKGYLIDKKGPRKPLENPCVITFKWTDETNSPPKDYPLKLALIQVSGDIRRKSTVEFNEKFDFAQRTVDEISKYSGYNTIEDTDESDGFQIVVVPAKGGAQLEADWPALVESGTMHYKNDKSNKKQKTNSAAASSYAKEDDDDEDDDEEEEEEDNDDDYDDEN